MKKIVLATALLTLGMNLKSIARDDNNKANPSNQAYHIRLKMADAKDSLVFLVHYYGKGGTTIYKSDSAMFKNGVAEFRSKDSTFVGGSYMILMSDKRSNFEFLLNRGDDITITALQSKLPEGIKFTNSPENEKFQDYQRHAKIYGEEQQGLVKELESAKTKADTADIRKRGGESAKVFADYRKKLVKENPGTLLANILRALEKPEVPEGDHFLEDGKTKDSTFAYRYYKAHYWDNFDFQDDRLIYTPLYDQLLDEYMSKMVLPWPDSVEHESDMILKKAKGTKDVFHYSLWWLTRNVENSKVMGISDVFVYMVENYYMKGDAFWLTNDELQKYIDRAKKMAPNVIGNVAPELKLPNVYTKKEESMLDTKAPYTVVVFYSPNCGHCKHELPQLDSAYEASLKAKGVKIYTVATEGDEKAIGDFLTGLKVDKKWINTWDPEHVSNYHNNYDVYSTPTIYLLDSKKIIIGKRLDHSNIGNVIDITERKLKDKAKTETKPKH